MRAVKEFSRSSADQVVMNIHFFNFIFFLFSFLLCCLIPGAGASARVASSACTRAHNAIPDCQHNEHLDGAKPTQWLRECQRRTAWRLGRMVRLPVEPHARHPKGTFFYLLPDDCRVHYIVAVLPHFALPSTAGPDPTARVGRGHRVAR